MAALHLLPPAPCHEGLVLDYLAEHARHGEHQITGSFLLTRQPSYAHWLLFLKEMVVLPDYGRVFLALRQDTGALVGMLCLYETKSPAVRQGGQIAYGVRPACRGQGFATEILRLALAQHEKRGETQVLVACTEENKASQRVLGKCGGSFAWTFVNPATAAPCRMYRFLLHENATENA